MKKKTSVDTVKEVKNQMKFEVKNEVKSEAKSEGKKEKLDGKYENYLKPSKKSPFTGLN